MDRGEEGGKERKEVRGQGKERRKDEERVVYR